MFELVHFVETIHQWFCFGCLDVSRCQFCKWNTWIFGSWHVFWQTAGFGFSSGCGGLFDAAAMFSAVCRFWLFNYLFIYFCILITPIHMLIYVHPLRVRLNSPGENSTFWQKSTYIKYLISIKLLESESASLAKFDCFSYFSSKNNIQKNKAEQRKSKPCTY